MSSFSWNMNTWTHDHCVTRHRGEPTDQRFSCNMEVSFQLWAFQLWVWRTAGLWWPHETFCLCTTNTEITEEDETELCEVLLPPPAHQVSVVESLHSDRGAPIKLDGDTQLISCYTIASSILDSPALHPLRAQLCQDGFSLVDSLNSQVSSPNSNKRFVQIYLYVFIPVITSHVQTQTNNMLVRLSTLSDFLSVALSSKLIGSYWRSKSLITNRFHFSLQYTSVVMCHKLPSKKV